MPGTPTPLLSRRIPDGLRKSRLPSVRGRLTRQRLAIVILVAVPFLAFSIAAAAGHMSISGDNNLQNFPLRVLAGKDLAAGQLPLWNPYIWSGTPLLAGFNAGAVYPLTLLFAILPSIPAWVITQIALYAIAAVGTFVFFRSTGRSVAAATAAAASFSFAGFLSSQIGHVDAIEAAAWLPWLLFALRHLALADRHRGCWTALLGAGLGTVILAASPETIVDDFLVVAFYAIWLSITHRDRTREILALTVIAGVLGLALGAVQWLPGLDWEGQSERARAAYSFFASGSLPPRETLLSVVPWLLGSASGNFGTARYAGPYNLTELNGYIGLLPLMAASGLLASRFRRHPKRGEWLGWYLLIALGLVLAWGGKTPIGHLLYHIPIYGQQRDQSRNLLLVDLGLAGLLASWIDVAVRPLRGGPAAPRGSDLVAERAMLSPRGRWPIRLRRTEVAWALLPVGVVVVVWLVFVLDPRELANALGAPALDRFGATQVDLTITLGIALAAAGAVLMASRLRPAGRIAAIGGVMFVDLLVYGAQQYTFVSAPTALLTGTGASELSVAHYAGPDLRVAFEDPRALPSVDILEYLGLPDYNVIEQVGSVNGYGSLLDGTYNAKTGVHGTGTGTLDIDAIANGTLEQLDVGILVTPSPSQETNPALDAALKTGGWVLAATSSTFSLWKPTRTKGSIWTVSTGQTSQGSRTGAVVRKLDRGSQGAWTAVVSSPRPVEVVRSVAYTPGWSAVLSGPGRSTRTVAVLRRDLVQGVRVPAGVTHVKWEYNPPGLVAGVDLTAAGALGTAGLAVADITLGSSALPALRRRRQHLPAKAN